MYLKFGCSGKKTVGLRRSSSRGRGEGQYQVYTNNDLGTAFLNPAAFFEVPFEHWLYSGLCFWHIFSAAALSWSTASKQVVQRNHVACFQRIEMFYYSRIVSGNRSGELTRKDCCEAKACLQITLFFGGKPRDWSFKYCTSDPIVLEYLLTRPTTFAGWEVYIT